MPKFLEEKLKREYPNNPSAVYGTLNRIGAMRGNKTTAKGEAMQAKHERDVSAGKASAGRASAPNLGDIARAARKTVRFPGGKPTLAAIIGRRRPKA